MLLVGAVRLEMIAIAGANPLVHCTWRVGLNRTTAHFACALDGGLNRAQRHTSPVRLTTACEKTTR
jgi:hypothetical protein